MFRSLVLSGALMLGAVPALAQPTGRPEPVAPNEPPVRQVEATVREFVTNFNESNIYFNNVDKVFSVRDYGYFGGPDWGESWEKLRGKLRLEVEKVEVSSLAPTTATTRVSYFWKNNQPRFRSQTIVENLKLQIGTPPNFGQKARWQIVPPTTPEDLQSLGIAPRADATGRVILPDNTPVLNGVAQSIANPKTAWGDESSRQTQTNLKQLGLAALQFAQDYDEKYALAPEFYKEALTPYAVRDANIWTIPATGEPYTFNGNLSGRSSANAQLPNSYKVVMFYEGQNEKPVFRYGGRAAILFADGHVALVSPDDAKNLVWKP